jgi:hypothetical protein
MVVVDDREEASYAAVTLVVPAVSLERTVVSKYVASIADSTLIGREDVSDTMDFELLTLEVDGSLANPFAAGAVAVWTAILCGIAVVLVWRARGSWRSWLVGAILFAGASLLTKPAQLAVGTGLYWMADHRVTGVGFWDGPPVWIAPLVASCIGLLTTAAVSHRRNRRAIQPTTGR